MVQRDSALADDLGVDLESLSSLKEQLPKEEYYTFKTDIELESVSMKKGKKKSDRKRKSFQEREKEMKDSATDAEMGEKFQLLFNQSPRKKS